MKIGKKTPSTPASCISLVRLHLITHLDSIFVFQEFLHVFCLLSLHFYLGTQRSSSFLCMETEGFTLDHP